MPVCGSDVLSSLSPSPKKGSFLYRDQKGSYGRVKSIYTHVMTGKEVYLERSLFILLCRRKVILAKLTCRKVYF